MKSRPLSGRLSLIICDLSHNKEMTATEIWEGRKHAPGDLSKTYLALSCGGTYAALHAGVLEGLIEVTETPGGRRFRLTPKGKQLARTLALEMKATAERALADIPCGTPAPA